MADRFDTQLIELGITLTEKQKIQFHRYYELLVEWNKVMNLTGITEYDEVNEKHFVDSLAIIKAVKMEEIHSVIDIGTGAGFPGIPLKIAFPHLKVVLLDSLQKRIHFLDTVIEELGLEEVETLHGRAEDYAKRKEYREQFDLCVSRAVANLATLSEYWWILCFLQERKCRRGVEWIKKSNQIAWRRTVWCCEIPVAGNGDRKIICTDKKE